MRGLMPTVLRVSSESDAPMKNSVSVSDLRARLLMNVPMAVPVGVRLRM